MLLLKLVLGFKERKKNEKEEREEESGRGREEEREKGELHGLTLDLGEI